MKIYVVIDTNVIVSAMLRCPSIPSSIVACALSGVITPLLNKEIVSEYRSVLMRPKFHLTNEIVDSVINTLEETGIYINSTKLDLNFPDPKDAVFYEVVMEKKKRDEAFLVTGNIKHFPKERFVVTPREMLEIIFKKTNSDPSMD